MNEMKIGWKKKAIEFLNRNKEIIVCALLGAAVFVFIYGAHVLDPCYTDWLLTSEDGDLTQHYLGWKFYRHAPWRFPFGMIDTMAYPNETSVIFTDSIPWFAFIFKIFRFLLPVRFQYFGWFGILCFMLQGGIGAKLVKKYVDSVPGIVAGGMFFVLSPVFIDRMYWMTALAGHFLCLLGLMFIVYYEPVYKNTKKAVKGWGILGMLCGGIHLYFLPMCGVILLGFVLLDAVKGRKKWKALLPLGSYLAAAAGTVFLFGGFASGMKAGNDGLGYYSFNLNGFWNPQGWSRYWKDMPCTDSQYEGFGYLGLGLLVLCLWALLLRAGGWLDRKNLTGGWRKGDLPVQEDPADSAGGKVGNWMKNHIWGMVWGLIGILTLLASVSHVVMYGEKVLFEFPLPKILYKAWSVFRASGRLIWPLVYLFVLGAVCAGRKKIGRRAADLMLVVCLLLQFADIRGMLAEKNEIYNKRDVYQTLLPSEGWAVIGNETDVEHICFVSEVVNERKQLFSFGDYASDYGLTLSNFYFARSLEGKEIEARDRALAECPSDTVFVFFQNEKQKCLSYPLNYYEMDGLVVGCSEPLGSLEPISGEDLAIYRYDMGSSRYLNNAEVTEEGWIIHSYGNSYGPYLYAEAGRYRVTATGSGMGAVDIKCYYNHGDNVLEPQNLTVEENRICYEVELAELAGDLECALWNIGGGDMLVESLVIEKVE